ncbi:MAG TPA: replicative DNA helicase, partial [Candidatus Dormibacteraeota bacterium]|nr:replicative DNA helicase [Candidatus Dormibacteraeota bacterium]
DAESRLFEVSQHHVSQDVISLEAILAESFDRLDDLHKDKDKIRGVPTGFKDLDNTLAGFQKSDLIILAARPSMGKTAMALNFAHNIAVQSHEAVLMFSLEMSKEQLVDRLLSIESGVDAWALRTGNLTDSDFEKIGQAMGTLSEAQIFIDDSPGITISDLRTKARREAHKRPLGLIIVDYLQLMSGASRYGGDGNRVQEISEISRGLKGVARELNIPVLALSQLSRSVESRNPQIPQLADLRESGCLAGDTPIYIQETGNYAPISTLAGQEGTSVCAVDPETYKLQATTAVKAFSTGRKRVHRLTTSTGRTIRATGNHKFLTIFGWKRLDELVPGGHIAVPRTLPSPNNNPAPMSQSRAALLGHLIGDGCTLPRHTIQYTTKDIDLAERVVSLAKEVFGERLLPRINPERQWYQVYLPATKHLTHGVRNPIASWLDELGVFGLRSHEKHVPRAVFEQSNEVVATFLRHLWATDGCVKLSKDGRYPAIYYASSSERLAREVQSLCLRLGMNTRLSRHAQKNKGRDQYHVIVSGSENLTKFVALVGGVGHSKTSQLTLVTKWLAAHVSNPNRDIIPKEVWRTYAVPAMQQAGITTRQMQAKLNTQYFGTTLYKSNLSRKRTALVADIVLSQELASLAASDVYWDRITSIEPDGIEEVFDLTVPGLHNFVAADIIVHNSIEQDSDVVAFIYREEYYNPDTDRKGLADIFIKKHRNGPTGGIELRFESEKQRFHSVDRRHQGDPFQN